jgi:hypothetical protein
MFNPFSAPPCATPEPVFLPANNPATLFGCAFPPKRQSISAKLTVNNSASLIDHFFLSRSRDSEPEP